MAPTATHDTAAPYSSNSFNHQLACPLPSAQLDTPPPADKSIFPDGLKSAGQHGPVESLVRPYSEFPKVIEGPTVWTGADFESQPDKWTRPFTPEEIEELGKAADEFTKNGWPLTGMSKDRFPLPTLGPHLDKLRDEIINGRGFVLFKNIPVDKWDLQKCATAYMGLGTYFGYFVTQNGRGHVLGHVKDLGEDPFKNEQVRIYRTNARQFFHTDGADLVGLLCIARSLEGGESDIASTHTVWNYLQEHHPDAAETLTKPIWYYDRKGEQSEGQLPYYRTAPFQLENDSEGKRRVYARLDPKNADTLKRFWYGPDAQLPPLSEEQLHALRCLEDTAKKHSLHMVLQPGDIQLLSNPHVFHARTAYKDWPAGAVDENGQERKRRHLMRLWLSTPEQEGGWKLAFPDSRYKKRGGVQVNNNPPHCPLDAE